MDVSSSNRSKMRMIRANACIALRADLRRSYPYSPPFRDDYAVRLSNLGLATRAPPRLPKTISDHPPSLSKNKSRTRNTLIIIPDKWASKGWPRLMTPSTARHPKRVVMSLREVRPVHLELRIQATKDEKCGRGGKRK